LGGSIFAFVPVSPAGIGAITQAHVRYRASFPLSLGAELSPLGLATAGGLGVAGALGMGWVAFDLPWLEMRIGAGILSNNRNSATPTTAQIEAGQLAALGLSLRVGYWAGFFFQIRGGISVGNSVGLGFVPLPGQIPAMPELAMTLAFSYGGAGNIEARGGIRYWLNGRGE